MLPQPSRRDLLRMSVGALGPALLAGCASTPPKPLTLAPLVLQPRSSAGPVTARFLGTTSVLFQDSETTILSDGFLTRPLEKDVAFGTIRPNERYIEETLTRLGVTKIAAVFTGHSHYDHALDAPTIAKLTGAVLLGSDSTRQVGLGGNLPDDRIHVVRDRETHRCGKFELTFFKSKHVVPEPYPGRIRKPVVPPQPAREWRTGETWSVKVTHEQRTLLVHGTANYRGDALRGQQVEVVYLGIGFLGFKTERFVRQYWNHVVVATRARRVILVHWDDTFGIDEPLREAAGFERASERIRGLAAASCVEVLKPVLWDPTDPFEGLRPPCP